MELDAYSALIRAVARLHPDGETDHELVRALSRLVGSASGSLHPARAASATAPGNLPTGGGNRPATGSAPSPSRRPAVPKPLDDADTNANQTATRTRRAPAGDGERLQAIRSVLEQIVEQADLLPERDAASGSASDQRAVERGPGPAAVPVEALFPPSRVRAILREMATVPTPSGAPDLDKAVEMISRARPIMALPRALTGTLPKAIHWLFESGPTMLPYARDKQQLAATATRLLGEDRMRLGDFISDPLKGVRRRGQVRWSPLRWPGARCALVVVSDLGIGSGDTVDAVAEWAWPDFLDQARQREVSTVLLNPYPRDRWPPVSAGFDVALTWDTAAGVQGLRRSRRHRPAH